MELVYLFGDFLNSEFFVALATIFVALAAYEVYRTQKSDAKGDAAKIVLIEIQNAERLLREAQDKLRGASAELLIGKRLLPVNSWDIHKYLFARDFDRDEWDRIGDFYNRCVTYDRCVAYNETFFEKDEEQIRASKLRVTTEYVKAHVDSVPSTPATLQVAIEKSLEFERILLQNPAIVQYAPMKPINEARAAIEGVDFNLSQSAAGSKLKKLAEI